MDDRHGRGRPGGEAPEEAAIVRRVWYEVRLHSYTEVAGRLNHDGVPHRRQRARLQKRLEQLRKQHE